MARSLRIQYPGAYYHVTCRGNARKAIYFDDDDRRRFLHLLRESITTYQVRLFGYVLMQNHFHLLIQTLQANLSEFMQRFNICYTGWFNHRHGRCGHVYQGRYKSMLIDADNYLLEVSRYVHLNPIRRNYAQKKEYLLKWQYLKKYKWTSLLGYINKRAVLGYIDYDIVLNMIGGRSAYTAFLQDGLIEGVKNPFKQAVYQTVLGDDDFLNRIKSTYIKRGSKRDQPSFRYFKEYVIEPSLIIDYFVKYFSVDKESLIRRRGDGVKRGLLAEFLYRYGALTLNKIGQLMGGIDYGGVHQLRRRLHKKMENNEDIRLNYHKIDSAFKLHCSK